MDFVGKRCNQKELLHLGNKKRKKIPPKFEVGGFVHVEVAEMEFEEEIGFRRGEDVSKHPLISERARNHLRPSYFPLSLNSCLERALTRSPPWPLMSASCRPLSNRSCTWCGISRKRVATVGVTSST